MGLKTHTGQANSNVKAQANTLSAKPLSPFKPEGTVKQTQTEPVPQSQTVGLSKPKQTQTKEPQLLSPSRGQTLSPSRRQFIEQYGAYALVTPVALYAMMSPNRAMAQAGSVGVVVDDAVAAARPTVLNDNERIENFDINTKTDGSVDEDGELFLADNEKYIAPDGVIYTCSGGDEGCYIVPTAGGGGKAAYGSSFDITYPDDIGSSDQAADDAVDDAVADTADDPVADAVADTADDPVADARPRVLNNQDRIETFDIETIGHGLVDGDGDLELARDEYYTTSDGTVYTCVLHYCYITPTEGGGGKASYSSVFSISYPDDGADFVGASILTGGDTVENFDIETRTDGLISFGDLELSRGQKYTATDGITYSCTTEICIITSIGELFPGSTLIGS